MRFAYNDGGRAAAGFKGKAGDCAVRAIAIATGEPYATVYGQIASMAEQERPRRGKRRSSPRTGVYGRTVRRLMLAKGWRWTPTMGIGTGCTVHLRDGELPRGPIVCNVSKHYVAVVDGVMHDTSDPSRGGTRCVYGYFSP